VALGYEKAIMAALGGAMILTALLFVVPLTNPLVIGLFWFILKVSAIVYVFIWFRGTFPRFRYDQLMRFGWTYLIPISIGALIVNGAVALLTQ
jgi:NADH-quinone oxidoreductase subunit H